MDMEDVRVASGSASNLVELKCHHANFGSRGTSTAINMNHSVQKLTQAIRKPFSSPPILSAAIALPTNPISCGRGNKSA